MIAVRHHLNTPSKSSGDSKFHPKRNNNNNNPINQIKVTDVSDLEDIFILTSLSCCVGLDLESGNGKSSSTTDAEIGNCFVCLFQQL